MATIFFNITKHFKKVLCYVSFISVFANIKAQTNLLLNPSFEQYTTCPNNTHIQGILNSKPDDWYKPDYRGAVYLNICQNLPPNFGIPYNGFGGKPSYQYPRTGDAYLGLDYLNSGYQNYIQIELLDSFTKYKKYYAEYYVNLSNASKYGCNNIGMLFTNNMVYADTINKSLLLANPQILSYGNPIVTDTLGWVKISGIFTAQGGEQYLTLGNFKSQANTQTKNIQPTGYDGSGYYVDDVAVYNLDSLCLKADAGNDITIQQGDSAFIGSYTNGIDSLLWLENGITKRDSTRPGFYVHPSSTTFYVLHQTVNGCFSSDTVFVNVLLPLNFIKYNVISRNEKSIENIWTTANEINVSHFNIQRSTDSKDFITIGKVAAQNKISNEYTFYDLPPVEGLGVVYYRIESIDFDGRKQYSITRTLNLKPQTLNSVVIFPNPATIAINITSQQNIQQIKLINQLGQTLKQLNNINTKYRTIDIEQFSKGIYVIQITTSNGEIKTQKIVLY